MKIANNKIKIVQVKISLKYINEEKLLWMLKKVQGLHKNKCLKLLSWKV